MSRRLSVRKCAVTIRLDLNDIKVALQQQQPLIHKRVGSQPLLVLIDKHVDVEVCLHGGTYIFDVGEVLGKDITA